MCIIFFKKRQKQINDLQKRIDELTKIVKNHEFERLQARSEELKLKDEQLGHIKLKVAKIVASDTNTGQPVITVTYELEPITLYVDDDGSVYGEQLKLFYAINRLDLISQDDMEKIRKVIDTELDKVKKV